MSGFILLMVRFIMLSLLLLSAVNTIFAEDMTFPFQFQESNKPPNIAVDKDASSRLKKNQSLRSKSLKYQKPIYHNHEHHDEMFLALPCDFFNVDQEGNRPTHMDKPVSSDTQRAVMCAKFPKKQGQHLVEPPKNMKAARAPLSDVKQVRVADKERRDLKNFKTKRGKRSHEIKAPEGRVKHQTRGKKGSKYLDNDDYDKDNHYNNNHDDSKNNSNNNIKYYDDVIEDDDNDMTDSSSGNMSRPSTKIDPDDAAEKNSSGVNVNSPSSTRKPSLKDVNNGTSSKRKKPREKEESEKENQVNALGDEVKKSPDTENKSNKKDIIADKNTAQKTRKPGGSLLYLPTKQAQIQSSYSAAPTRSSSSQPNSSSSGSPTLTPSSFPSSLPTTVPSSFPSSIPTSAPSVLPTTTPSVIPTTAPSVLPTTAPSILPTTAPSVLPTAAPSISPSLFPSLAPSSFHSSSPSSLPSLESSSPPTGIRYVDVFAATGQSNAYWPPNKEKWYEDIANSGSYGFGRGVEQTLINSGKFSEPVVVINGAPGRPISFWYADGSPRILYEQQFFGNFMNQGVIGEMETLFKKIREEGKVPRFRGLFWFQGESDGTEPGQKDTSTGNYIERWNGFISELEKDVTSKDFVFVLNTVGNSGKRINRTLKMIVANDDRGHVFDTQVAPFRTNVYDIHGYDHFAVGQANARIFLSAVFGSTNKPLRKTVDIFVATGQSNACWPLTKEYLCLYGFGQGVQNVIESSGKFSSPIVIMEGEPGNSINLWWEDGEPRANYKKHFFYQKGPQTGSLESTFDKIISEGNVPRFRGLFWFQGEANGEKPPQQNLDTSTQDYMTMWNGMIGQLEQDIGSKDFGFVVNTVGRSGPRINFTLKKIADSDERGLLFNTQVSPYLKNPRDIHGYDHFLVGQENARIFLETFYK